MKHLFLIVFAVWVARWTWVEQVPVECECAKPSMNQYSGKMEHQATMCAAYCAKAVETKREKRFKTEDEARLFLEGCKEKETFYGFCDKMSLEAVSE